MFCTQIRSTFPTHDIDFRRGSACPSTGVFLVLDLYIQSHISTPSTRDQQSAICVLQQVPRRLPTRIFEGQGIPDQASGHVPIRLLRAFARGRGRGREALRLAVRPVHAARPATQGAAGRGGGAALGEAGAEAGAGEEAGEGAASTVACPREAAGAAAPGNKLPKHRGHGLLPRAQHDLQRRDSLKGGDDLLRGAAEALRACDDRPAKLVAEKRRLQPRLLVSLDDRRRRRALPGLDGPNHRAEPHQAVGCERHQAFKLRWA
mmetsp:Transcript_25325/g.84576  ORF Transcript_25325/g.84576 Transcript_25325/m.84576 type:complete len:262 (+) Transcript_25325:226-1011(+)